MNKCNELEGCYETAYNMHISRTTQGDDVTCKMCGKRRGVSGCSTLAQIRYLQGTILVFETLGDLGLVDSVPPGGGGGTVRRKLFGERGRKLLGRMQKSVISSSLSISRGFKVSA